MNGKADCYKKSNDCSVITRKDGGAVIVKGSGSGNVSVENGGGYANRVHMLTKFPATHLRLLHRQSAVRSAQAVLPLFMKKKILSQR